MYVYSLVVNRCACACFVYRMGGALGLSVGPVVFDEQEGHWIVIVADRAVYTRET